MVKRYIRAKTEQDPSSRLATIGTYHQNWAQSATFVPKFGLHVSFAKGHPCGKFRRYSLNLAYAEARTRGLGG